MIRKLLTIVEETHEEANQAVRPPIRKAAAIAVIWNPCVGHQSTDLSELLEFGEELGGLLSHRAVSALGIDPTDAHSYGKAAIVGADGELEHAAAILRPKMSAVLGTAADEDTALIPSTKKRGGIGATIDVSLGHADAGSARSHFDTMEIRVSDAPRRDEIVVAVVVTERGRVSEDAVGTTVERGKD
jgi:hypothetical protein